MNSSSSVDGVKGRSGSKGSFPGIGGPEGVVSAYLPGIGGGLGFSKTESRADVGVFGGLGGRAGACGVESDGRRMSSLGGRAGAVP